MKQDHSDCIEHFKLAGFQKKICVVTGQTRESVLQSIHELQDKNINEVSNQSTSRS